MEQKRLKLKLNNGLKLWGNLYGAALFIWYPLYYQDSYLNILEAKTDFFMISAVVFLVGCGILYCAGRGDKQDRAVQKNGKIWLNPYFYLLIFTGAVVLSTLLAEDRQNALWGTDGKMFGAGVILLCCGLFVAASRFFTWSQIFSWSALVGAIVVSVLTILSRFGIDPMKMYDRIDSSQIRDYLGTIGQKNIVSGVLCIFAAIVMGCFLCAGDRVSRALFGMGVVLGVAAGFCANSDSFFLGMAAVLMFLLWAAVDSWEGIKAYYKLLLFSLAGILLVRLCCDISDFNIPWGSLHTIWLEGDLLPIAIAVMLMAGTIIWRNRNKLAKADYSRCRRFVLPGMGALAVAALVILIYANLAPHNIPGKLARYLVFNDSWGTNRGYVWNRTLKAFVQLPLWQQLFGVGPGGFFSFFGTYHGEAAEQFGYYFADAHNDLLQYLVTVGILGLTGYVGMIFSSLYRCIKAGTSTSLIVAGVLFAWLAQGIVNNPLVFTAPYLFFFLGVCQREI